MKTKTRKSYTPEERAAYREQRADEAAAMMQRAVAELLTSDGWQRWARCRARMNRYSFNNTMLIVMQCPEASMVCSYKQWRELNRGVMQGQHALRIFAPLLRWPTEDDIRAGHPADRKLVYGFRLVPVFDVSQTDGEELPEPVSEPVTGDSHARYLPALELFALQLGYEVAYEDLSAMHAGGYCDAKRKRIVIEVDQASNACVRTLVHELAHALGVGYQDYGREAAEVIVETATFIVCDGIGLDTSGEAIPYVAGWGEQDAAEAITKFGSVVHTVARQIENAINTTQEQAA